MGGHGIRRWRLATFVAALASFAAVGCELRLPGTYPSSTYKFGEINPLVKGEDVGAKTIALDGELSDQLAAILDERYPPPWTAGDDASEDMRILRRGAQLYQQHCIHCHGLAGGGDGPTAEFLFPLPRDYRRGIFKWRSTERGAKPTHADLVRLLRDGANGTSMPPFNLLPEHQLDALARYVRYLSERGELEYGLLRLLTIDAEADDPDPAVPLTVSAADVEFPDEDTVEALTEQIVTGWEDAEDRIVEAPAETQADLRPDSDELETALDRGKQLYLSEKASCYKCHGADGSGRLDGMDPTATGGIYDDWGHVNYARNLHLGLYAGGGRDVDLYRRIKEGIWGAQMPASGTRLSDAELWDLVTFVQKLPSRPQLLAKPHGSMGSVR